MYPRDSCCSFSFGLSIIHTTLVTMLDVSSCVQTHATDVSSWWQWEGPANSWDKLWNQTLERCQSVHHGRSDLFDVQSSTLQVGFPEAFKTQNGQSHSTAGLPHTLGFLALQWSNGCDGLSPRWAVCWSVLGSYSTVHNTEVIMFYICFIFSTANTLQPCFELCDHKSCVDAWCL